MAPRLTAALGGLALVVAGCGGAPVPELRPREGVYHLEAGRRYSLSYATAIDTSPVGCTWTGDALGGSPLAAMARPALVIKADDFGPDFESIPVRFVEAVDAVRGVASLGIITGRLTQDAGQRAAYRELHAAGFELWFHGHRHRTGRRDAEFEGEKLQVQRSVFDRGLAIGRNELGVRFRTFGAPGNGNDPNTGLALAQEPQVAVWLLGLRGYGPHVFDRSVAGEHPVGVALDPVEADPRPGSPLPSHVGLEQRRLEVSPPDATVLQVHPRMWNEASLERFIRLLRLVADGQAWRFTGPFDEWCWLADRAHLVVTKASDTTYEVDLRSVEHDLRLDLDPAVGPLPATVQPLD